MRRDDPRIILIDDEMFVVRFDGLTKSSCVARNIPPHRSCSTQMVLLPCQIFRSDHNPIIEVAWKLPPANFYCFKLSSWNRINSFSISGDILIVVRHMITLENSIDCLVYLRHE